MGTNSPERPSHHNTKSKQTLLFRVGLKYLADAIWFSLFRVQIMNIYLQVENSSTTGEYIRRCVLVSSLFCMTAHLIHTPDARGLKAKLNIMVH